MPVAGSSTSTGGELASHSDHPVLRRAGDERPGIQPRVVIGVLTWKRPVSLDEFHQTYRTHVRGRIACMAAKRGRSAKTGRFVKQSTVKKNPSTTVNESTKKRKKK